ncbi:MAG: DUF2330 domain-containing protein [Planctomycetes bacterium]|nr:DUF2330 domain-containing protein [Planctomycetota bacterium]
MGIRACTRMLAAIFAIVLCSARACADGKVFASHAAPAEIPDQSALICFDGKTETLAIETRFIAKGKDFAWVVPLPARPEIRAGTPGMFPTLRAMFLPRMWELEGAGVLIGLLVILGVSVGLGMLGAGENAARVAVWGILGWLFLTGCLLTSLGSARSAGAGGGSGVAVLKRAVIGDFNVSVVESVDAGAMKEWLATNGFQSTAQADAAIGNYVKHGWVFVVSKLRRSFDEARMSAPTPLIFTFETSRPVYPMQLTGAGATTPLKLELFVFGRAFAFGPGFESVRRAEVSVPDDGPTFSRGGTGHVQVTHSLLKELLGKATHATRLRRTLSPSQMDRDIEIEFRDAAMRGNTVASRAAAWQSAIAMGLAVFSVTGVGLMRWAAQIGPWPAGFRRLGASAAAGCVVGLIFWTLTPQVSATESAYSDFRRRRTVLDACYRVVFGRDATPPIKDKDPAAVANAAMEFMRGDPSVIGVRIEDSPGNFVVRDVNGMLVCVYYSWNGQEIIQGLN